MQPTPLLLPLSGGGSVLLGFDQWRLNNFNRPIPGTRKEGYRMKKLTTIVIMLVLAAVLVSGCEETEAEKASRQKSKNVEGLVLNQPGNPVRYSMDRFLLNQRNQRLNNPSKMCYLYINFLDGTWIKTTIIGKMASTSKRLSNSKELVMYRRTNDSSTYTLETGPAPDDMGTWGQSDPAHVGMTTLGSLIEVGGFVSYIYSETPLIFTGMEKKMIEIKVEASPEEIQIFKSELDKLRKKWK